jgi:alanine racemase
MTPQRWAWAEIDLDAIGHNVEVLRRVVAPAAVWAVVKADGYGHGAVRTAKRTLQAGAEALCVALVDEGIELRQAGIDVPILLLAEQPTERADDVVRYRLTPTVYSRPCVDQLSAAAAHSSTRLAVHVNVDTGMQRVGVPVHEAPAIVRYVADHAPAIELAGVYTHLACADEPSSPASAEQLERFDRVLAELDSAGLCPPLVHVANSAGALAIPATHRSLVRAGIAIYGISPGPGVDHLTSELRPALTLKARLSVVKRVVAGSSISYGWRHRFDVDTTVATLPIGYADGVPRRLGTLPDRPGADVLIGGRRCPIVGVVTMDQLMVDVGQADVGVGDEAVLIGEQGDERIGVAEWADRLGTIGYEIVCGIGRRIPRLEVGDVPGGWLAGGRAVTRGHDRAARDQPERSDISIETPGTSPSS